jgi:hypothetical protein
MPSCAFLLICPAFLHFEIVMDEEALRGFGKCQKISLKRERGMIVAAPFGRGSC